MDSKWSADGYGALEHLPRLRRLHCMQLKHLPACLSRLTRLVCGWSRRVAATLQAGEAELR